MTNTHVRFGVVLALLCGLGTPLLAGGRLLTDLDFTGFRPSPIPGQIIAKVLAAQWDTRQIPVQFRVNGSLNPIPNPIGPSFVSVADATGAIRRAMRSWNDIPTSFIRMEVAGTVNNPGVVGFDFVNELTFRADPALTAGLSLIAISVPTTLVIDLTFAPGEDIDGDGDPDFLAGISRATDVDGDGDLELPAGFYKAGTILDNDVQFDTDAISGIRFTTADADIDTNHRSADLEAIAVHELGHAIGLSHTLINQKSARDGNGATMYPGIDLGDPVEEFEQRSLESDDIAWASFIYPEGSAPNGVAAIQRGDIPFASVYGLITGEVRHGVLNQPIAGAHVWASDRRTGEIVASAFSGDVQVSVDPETGSIDPIDAGFAVLDGRYTIPVPKGDYEIGVEAVDGFPRSAGSISLTTIVGALLGQLDFNEEMFKASKESAVERRPGDASTISIRGGQTRAGIDITTNRTLNINNFGDLTTYGFGGVPPGTLYALRFPKTQIQSIRPGQDILIPSALFHTLPFDRSTPALFAKAALTTGSVNPATGAITAIDLVNPLEEEENFLSGDNDFGVLYFHDAKQLGERVRKGMARGRIEDLFLVLQLPTTAPFPGVSGGPPLIGLDTAGPFLGLSYASLDGGVTWIRVAANFRFSLVVGEPPK
jgi:hypothetical protein